MQKFEQPCRPVVRNVVEQGLRFAPEGDDAILSKAGEMLRQRRLAETHSLAERRYAKLARRREVAKDEQALLIAKAAQQCSGICRLRGQLFDV